MVPAPVAALLTREVTVPTVGIGAGGGTSGQVQVRLCITIHYYSLLFQYVRVFVLFFLTREATVPTVGIGAGGGTSGEVQVRLFITIYYYSLLRITVYTYSSDS